LRVRHISIARRYTYGLYRNSYAHRNVDHNDADEAAEIIMLANHLLRIVDAREAIKGQQP
jgi:hypothetical protein